MITVDFSRLTVSPGDRILDIGCGSGRHTCAAYRLKGCR
jgi:precorrin-6B methylase 2